LHDVAVDLSNFQLITWSQGTTFPAFVHAEVNALQTFLDGGGNLFINGQDIGSDIFEPNGQSQFAQGFYNNYLHADYIANVGGSFYIQGYDGDPITDGIVFPIGDVYEKSADVISPFDADATPILKFMNVPDINSIRVSTGTYNVVYFGIGLEQINDEDIRDTLMQRIINFNGVEPLQLPSVPNLISPANSDVIDSSSTLFVWEESQSQVSTYWFELDTTDQFTTAYVNTSVADTTFLYSNLQYDKSYWWRVKAYNGAGWSDFSDIRTFTTVTPVSVDDEQLTPSVFSLDQNYPNPFNPSTIITYSLANEEKVSLKVYDIMGQVVLELVNEKQSAGSYSVEFDASSFSSGLYIYSLTAGSFKSAKKMVLMK
jgi:hydrogenase maturation factor